MDGNSLIEKLLNALSITGGMRIASGIIISLGVILILGFLMTRLTKLLKLPNVIAYLVVGIIIGPSLINLIPGEFITRTSFISDVALVLVAFTAGEFFKINEIKKSIGKAIAITAIECVATFALIFVLCFFAFRLDAPFSLVLAALASATAPTSTIMTIKQTESKGHYVTTLLEVLAIDGVIALLLYTISISIFVGVADGNALSFADIAWPLAKMLICLLIGIIFGFALGFLISSKRTTDNRLIIVIAVLLLFCGICSLLGQSPLLGGIAIGAVYTNLSKKEEKIFAQINYFMPPIMLIFFVRGGMSLDFSVFTQSNSISAVPFIFIVLAFLVVRFMGKYGGTYLGSLATAQPKETRNFLGFGLIPQASVAIALANMAALTISSLSTKLSDSTYDEYATALLAIILASSIIFELIGPVLAKVGLYLSHSYGLNVDDKAVEDKEEKSNEEAYTEAAEQYHEE